ncbi:STAS/SEC14 domain-containing protein [Haloferula sargassicola]|uniref:STAS/SEC14 domain-containing protein n=1 Tax=Haloferula sargassicola TaxID=490096 RepID=A0ABP9ULV3_9BACT
MFKIHRTGNHLDMTFGGQLDAEGMHAVLDEFCAQSEGIENGTLLYRVEDFQIPTPHAIAIEISRMPKMLRLMRRFRRAAILAEKDWIRKISEWEGKLLPGLEIKAFTLDEETEAQTWLTRP